MRRTCLFTVLCVAACSLAAQTFNTRLLPSPQRVERAQGYITSPYTVQHRMVRSIAGAANPDLAYRLLIGPEGVTVEYVDLEGYEYGMRTLDRLAEAWHDSLPCMTLTDWPAYRYRGFLDDVSRGPIPSAAFTAKQLALAERLELNANTYYTEHTAYSDSMPDLAPLAARQLPTAATHPSVIPNLQCLAHYEKVLCSPFYADIMDSPATLNPAVEETYSFLRQRLDEVARANLRARFFHINADETEALGSGRARRYVDSLGQDEAYFRHIRRVAAMLKHYGFRLLMWGDIVAKHPNLIGRLPSYITYVAWSYVPLNSYAAVLQPFVEQRAPFWVAASASHHGTIAPDPAAWRQNIAHLARDGAAAGAEGFCLTVWDDSGESLFGACSLPLAWAAEMAWHPIAATDPEAAQAELEERWQQFEVNYARQYGQAELASWRTLAAVRAMPQVGQWFDASALFAPLPSAPDTARAAAVEAALNALPTQDLTPHTVYALHRLQLTAARERLAAALATADSTGQAEAQVRQFMAKLLSLKREYLRLWDAECTDYWRNTVAGRYDQLGRQLLDAPWQVAVKPSGRQVALSSPNRNATIYYTLDGSRPTTGSAQYSAPLELEHSCTVKAMTLNRWGEPVYTERYTLVHQGLGAQVRLGSTPSAYRQAYLAGGTGALTDGLLGDDRNYADGHWQGFQGCDIDAALDLGTARRVETIAMRFLQCPQDWVLSPQTVEIYTSHDGRRWQLVHTEHLEPDFRTHGTTVQNCVIQHLNLNTRHLRVVARNAGPLPQWHPSAGQQSFLFCDEIQLFRKQ